MAPKRTRVAGSSSSSRPNRFVNDTKAEHYKLIKMKGIVQERSIDFTGISFLPEMHETTEQYRWMDFNMMIGKCNICWVEEFYANALGYAVDDYASTVQGKTISYAPEVIDEMFGFRPA
ncbi:hypothetical protein A2U01_0048260, partial [Trifolium medium]|nr:hypothetical protein [Trifolium medium]